MLHKFDKKLHNSHLFRVFNTKKNTRIHVNLFFTTNIQACGCLIYLLVNVLSKIKHYYIFPMLLEYNVFKYSMVGYLNIFNSLSI